MDRSGRYESLGANPVPRESRVSYRRVTQLRKGRGVFEVRWIGWFGS